jgi:hypothetical protein
VNADRQPSRGHQDQRSPVIDRELFTALQHLRRVFGRDQVRVVQVVHRTDSTPSQPPTAAQRTRPTQPASARPRDREVSR